MLDNAVVYFQGTGMVRQFKRKIKPRKFTTKSRDEENQPVGSQVSKRLQMLTLGSNQIRLSLVDWFTVTGPGEGVPGPGRGVSAPGGVPGPGGCQVLPPVNRMTNRCKCICWPLGRNFLLVWENS